MQIKRHPGKIARVGVAAYLLAATCAASAAGSLAVFPSLSQDEAARLDRGEAVVRSAGSWSRLAIPLGAPGAAELKVGLSDLRPNYLTEVLALLPATDPRALSARLNEALAAVSDYPRIPYYSTKWKKFFPLFNYVRILSRTMSASAAAVAAELSMDPFDPFPALYIWQLNQTSVQFSCVNTGAISYKGIKAVQPEAMTWRLVLYRQGDNMVFYGVGAVKAFDMFGAIRDRLEPSFLGRTEAFFSYMLELLR